MVWIGLVLYGLIRFFVLQLVKVVLVSICTKFELSMCLVCPKIEINVCSAYFQNVLVRFFSETLWIREHCFAMQGQCLK